MCTESSMLQGVPSQRRFKSLDHSYQESHKKLPTYLPNLISLAAKKYREQARSVKGDGSKLTKQVESFTRLAQAYSTGIENKAQKPSSRGIRSLLSAALDDQNSFMKKPKSLSNAPLKLNEIKMPKLRGQPLSYRETN